MSVYSIVVGLAMRPGVQHRPFLFVVHDDLTGSLLFAARVADPTSE